MANPGDLTLLLRKVSQGDANAEAELMERVYGELRRLAAQFIRRERPGHTLQATALVHEAFMRLSDGEKITFTDRTHFFAVAAQIMRRLLVDHARKRASQKRGGGNAIPLDDSVAATYQPSMEVTQLGAALDRLESAAPRQAKIVEMRYFGGLSVEEIAQHLGISARTVKRDWVLARATLYGELNPAPKTKSAS
jgi:RNA polymerase sigma-70 factor (ECF subfamily)